MRKVLSFLAITLTALFTRAQTYCVPYVSNPTWDTEIFNVMINGAQTPTAWAGGRGCLDAGPGQSSVLSGYSDFTQTGPLTSMQQGAVVPFSVAVNECDGSYYVNSFVYIWVDFNQDGDFLDTDERVYFESSATVSPRTVSGTFTVPASAVAGPTRARIMAFNGTFGSGGPCDGMSYGETEDYQVVLTPTAACSGAPAPNSINSILTPVCYTTPVSVSLAYSYSTNVTYQWYASNTSSAGPFAPIPGATLAAVALNSGLNTWLRVGVTCGVQSNTITGGQVRVLNTPLSGVYTINSASATSGSNFQSFSDLSSVLNCVGVAGPVTVNVVASSGPYTERPTFYSVNGASATNSILINGNSNTLTYNPVGPPYRVMSLDGARHFSFQNLILRSQATSPTVCHLTNNANYNSFSNCTFSCQTNGSSNGQYPIALYEGSSFNTWSNCTILGGYAGVYIQMGSQSFGESNNFYNNIVRDFYVHGFYLSGAKNSIIKGNLIEHLIRVVFTNYAQGISLEYQSTGVLIEGNRVRKLFASSPGTNADAIGIGGGAYTTATERNTIRNNVISDLTCSGRVLGIQVYAGYTDIEHNTIAINHAAATTTNSTDGISLYNSSGSTVRNNIITINRGGTGLKHCIRLENTVPAACDYNLLYNTSASNAYTGKNASTSYSTLAQWQASPGNPDLSSVAADPSYVNAATGNFQPSNSGIDNRGLDLNVATDFTNVARDANTPDVGAYEFTGTACSGTPSGGTLSVSGTTTCPTTLIYAQVSGGTTGAGIGYAWQTSPSSSGPWTNVAGANGLVYSGLQTNTVVYYQRVTTCSASALSATSTVESYTLSAGAMSGTYSVNSANSTGGGNFQTFGDLAAALNCLGVAGPVTVNVVSGSGPYSEQVEFNDVSGASATNSILINGNDNQLTYFGQVYPNSHVLRLNGASFFTFNNLYASSLGTLAMVCHLRSGANNNTFNNCMFECLDAGTFTTQVAVCINGGNGYFDILTDVPSNNNAFNTCTVIGGYAGAAVTGGYYVAQKGNIFENCLFSDFGVYGIYNRYSQSTIRGNTIERLTRATPTAVHGICLEPYSGGSVIDRNKIWKLTDGSTSTIYSPDGIYLKNGAANSPAELISVTNNVIGNFNCSNSHWGIDNQSRYVEILHNTIGLDNNAGGVGTGISDYWGIGVVVKNNIIRVTGGGFATRWALLYYAGYVESDYNVIWSPVGTYNKFCRLGYLNYNTMAEWQAVGFDANGLNLDPNFTSLSGNNFLPTNSLINNRATPLGITVDINNASRSTIGPDAGAFEWGVNPCILTASVAPSLICAGSTATLSAGGATSYTWSVGGSGPTTTFTPWTYTTVTVSGSSSSCAVWSHSFAVMPYYIPLDAQVSDPFLCTGESLTLTASGAPSFTWSSGVTDGVGFVPSASSSYTLVGEDGSGCANTSVVTITVNPIPSISVNSGSVCSGNPFVMAPTGALTYTFSGGSATVSPLSNNTYSVSGTSAAGCTSTLDAVSTISVVALPSISVNSGSICSGNSFTMVPSGAATYTYSSGSAIVTPNSSASYSVTGTSAVGCVGATTAVANITVEITPTVSVNSGTICNGQSFTFAPSGADSFTFSSGTAIVNPNSTTSYTITGINNTGCNSSAIRSVTVHQLPVISVNSGSVCLGKPFVMLPSGASVYNYSSGSATVFPASTTSYSVSGTSSAGCTSSLDAIASVSVVALPTISVNSGTVCSGNSFTMVATGADSYTYEGGNSVVSPPSTTQFTVSGTSSVGCVAAAAAISSITVFNTPTVTASSGSICAGYSYSIVTTGANTYSYSSGSSTVSPSATGTVLVTGYSAVGCSATAVSNITVHALPVVTINSGSVCAGQSHTFVPQGTSTYTFLNGSTIVSPGSTTTFSVIGTSSVGCISPVEGIATVTVHALPVISVNSGSICSGSVFTMVATGASTYIYQGNSTTVSPSSNSTFSVTGTSSVGCPSSNTAIASITVGALPVVSVNSGSICAGDVFTMTPSGAVAYVYSSGDATVMPAQTTTYQVTGTGTNGCISLPAVSSVTVNALPLVSVNSGTICEGQTFTILPSGAVTYSYSSGTPFVSPPVNTDYTVTGYSGAGCAGADVVSTVTVFTNPTITVSGGSICAGTSYTISPAGANSYSISGGSNVVSPGSTTNFTVSGISQAGCASPTPVVVTVSVMANPVISVNSGTICAGESFTLFPQGTATFAIPGGSFVVTPLAPVNVFSITGTNTEGCTASINATVIVKALPVITASAVNPTICAGDSTNLFVVGGMTYVWNTAETTSLITVAPTATKVYTVTGTGSNGCFAVAMVTQEVSTCDGIASHAAFGAVRLFPNPNTGVFNVECSSPDYIIEVSDVTGRLVRSQRSETQNQQVDMREMAKGLYHVTVQHNGERIVFRVIVE